MPLHIQHSRVTYGPLSPLRSVEATAQGLRTTYLGGVARVIPWQQVHGVEWLRSGVAQVVFDQRRPLRLPAHHPGLDDLIAGIDRAATAAIERWHDPAARERQIRAWLGLGAGERLTVKPGGIALADYWRTGLAVLTMGLVLWCARGALAMDTREAAMTIAGLVMAVVAVTARDLVDLRAAFGAVDCDDVRANGRGLTVLSGDDERSVAWDDLVSMMTSHPDERSVIEVALVTRSGSARMVVSASRAARLLRVCRRIIEANTAHFERAADGAVPETGLSLARLDGAPEAERGLSQSDGRPGSADLQVRTSPEQCGPGGPRSQEE